MIVDLFSHLFTSKVRIKLLYLFFTNPDKSFFVREISRLLDDQINAIRRELAQFQKVNMLLTYNEDGKKYFKLNSKYMFYDEIFLLIKKSTLPAFKVLEKFEEAGEKLDLLLFTGRLINEFSSKIPIDIFVVGNVLEKTVSTIIDKCDESEKIRYTIISKEVFLEKIEQGDKKLITLLKYKKNIIPINNLI
jgi:hypothetical protein